MIVKSPSVKTEGSTSSDPEATSGDGGTQGGEAAQAGTRAIVGMTPREIRAARLAAGGGLGPNARQGRPSTEPLRPPGEGQGRGQGLGPRRPADLVAPLGANAPSPVAADPTVRPETPAAADAKAVQEAAVPPAQAEARPVAAKSAPAERPVVQPVPAAVTAPPAPVAVAPAPEAKAENKPADAPLLPRRRPEPTAGRKNRDQDIRELPTVGAARLHLRHYVLFVLFLLMVVAPPVVYGTYLYTLAADRYESDVGFGSRTEETSNTFDMLGVLGGGNTSTRDMDILNQVVLSQGLIEAVDDKLNLRVMYSRHPEDWLFSFPADGPIEDLVGYWRKMVRVTYDASTGLMKLKIYAFTPDDAQAIAQATLDESAEIINDLSKTAQDDTTRYSAETLAKAEERYRAAQNALTEFRIKYRIVDPQTQLQGASQVLNTLVQQLAEAEIGLDMLRGTVPENDPRISTLNRRIEVIRNRIATETSKVGTVGSPQDEGYAQLIRDYQNLQVEMEFAQKSWLAAQGAYDQAVNDAAQRTRYLATFLRPTLAESSTSPNRVLHIALTVFAGLMAWAAVAMVYYALRDRR